MSACRVLVRRRCSWRIILQWLLEKEDGGAEWFHLAQEETLAGFFEQENQYSGQIQC
jgi:hypothetical protein